VVRTTVGYTGGTTATPDYKHIGDHSEAIRVEFDPQITSYRYLLEVFWASHDPGQESWSRQYRNAVFVTNETQRTLTEQSRGEVAARIRKPVHTAIELAGTFYPAEDYHQKYLLRRAKALFTELRDRYADEAEMLASTTAARINGYLGCNGYLVDLERELDSFGLSVQGREQLLDYFKSSCRDVAGPTCPKPQ